MLQVDHCQALAQPGFVVVDVILLMISVTLSRWWGCELVLCVDFVLSPPVLVTGLYSLAFVSVLLLRFRAPFW
jgi:hypothetical protein